MPLVDLARVHELFGSGLRGDAPFSGALVSKNIDQSIPNLASRTLLWQIETYDIGGWFASSGDTFFTIPPGITRVELTAGVKWGSPAGGAFRSVDFRKNGSVFPGATKVLTTLGAAAVDAHGIVSPAVEVVAGDELSVEVFQVSGAALDVEADAATFFGIRAIEGFSLSAQAFTFLVDTPNSYFGEAGKHLHVNSAETAVEFGQALRTIDSPQFIGLTATDLITTLNLAVTDLATVADLTTTRGRFISQSGFAMDANTQGMGRRQLYRCTNTAAPRILTIRTADIATGSPQPWVFTVKDESGGANANNITIVTQGAETIDGAASVAITEDYGSIKLYSNGANLFSI